MVVAGPFVLVEAPNLKSQILNKFQAPIANFKQRRLELAECFGHWSLKIGAYLGIDVWNLVIVF